MDDPEQPVNASDDSIEDDPIEDLTGPDSTEQEPAQRGAQEATHRGASARPSRGPRGAGLRSLGVRTIAICVCVALVAALGAALLMSLLTGASDSDSSDGQTAATIQLTDRVDTDALLATGLLTIEGQPTTLGERLADQPVVVNLWAQSCAPCIKEMPLLEQASLDNPNIDFLGVDTQDRLDSAKVMAERTGITYPWVQDPQGDFFVAAQGAGMPTTFIIMPSGEIVASKTGSFDSQSELQGWLDANVS